MIKLIIFYIIDYYLIGLVIASLFDYLTEEYDYEDYGFLMTAFLWPVIIVFIFLKILLILFGPSCKKIYKDLLSLWDFWFNSYQ